MWNDLTMSERADVIKMAVKAGLRDMKSIRDFYDNSLKYADGGSIHIDPSKRGTFTTAATKHGMGVQEFASKVLANKDNYSPTMVKKANFAKNASKWKHCLGGYLFEEGGPKVTLVDSDKVRMNDSGIFSDENGNIIGDSIVLPEFDFTKERELYPNSQFVQSNDNVWVDNGRVKNPELLERGLQGAKSHAEWEREHPVLNTWGTIAGAVPFAVAAAPLAPYIGMAGDALATTSVGNTITSSLGTMGSYITAPTLLGAPAYAWGDAALSSAFAAHGINNAIEEGGVSPETLLEVAPLGQIVPKLSIDANKLLSKGYNKIKKQVTAPKRLARIKRENWNIGSAAHDASYINPMSLSEEELNVLPYLRKPVSEIKEQDAQIDKLVDLWSRNFTPARPKQHLSKLEKGILKTTSKQLTKSDAELIGDVENIIPYGKENVRKYLEKNLRDPSILDNLIITDGGIYYNSSSKAFNPLNAVTTGNIKMVDAATGKESMFKLESDVFNTSGIRTYKYPNFRTPERETQAQAIYPNLPKEYTDAVQKNIDFVTNEAVPGSKVFGSSANVSRGNLYHDASDIDVMMPESIAKKHKDFNKWNQESPDTYAYQHPTAGKIDVNILKNDNNGKAIGSRAHELYAQLYPKEYKALMDKYIAKGDKPSVDLPLNKSSEELFKNYDPVVKSIADAFGSGKEKHMKRAVYLLHYGKTNDVKKGFEMYANYLTAGEYKPSNLSMEAFSNPTKNSEIIDALGLNGINKEQFVDDPERMKLLFDYGYFHEGFLGRGIYVDKAKDIYPSFTTWLPEGRGGTVMGVGLNTVLGGNSGAGNIYAAIVPEKLNMQFMTKDPIQLLEARRALLGRKPLTQDEIHTIDKLAQKHNINNMDNVDSFAEALSRTENKSGQNYKDFLEDIEREFGIPAIQGKENYNGGAPYVSVTKDLPNSSVKQIIPDKLDRPVSSTLRDAASFQINDPYYNTFDIFSNVGASSKVRNSKLTTRKLNLTGPEINPLLQLIERKKEALLEENTLSKSAIKSKADEMVVRTHSRSNKLKKLDNKMFENARKVKLAGKTLTIAAGGALLQYLWSKLDKSSKEDMLRRKEERRRRKEQKVK